MIYLLIASYLIGSISSAVIICKALGVPDPRTQGSKNPGATNVLRLGGKKIAAFVLFFDGLKGAVPVFIGEYYGFGLIALTLTALCAFLGHIFPVFFRFKGGKIPNGTIKFENLKSVQTDCIRGDPDEIGRASCRERV